MPDTELAPVERISFEFPPAEFHLWWANRKCVVHTRTLDLMVFHWTKATMQRYGSQVRRYCLFHNGQDRQALISEEGSISDGELTEFARYREASSRDPDALHSLGSSVPPVGFCFVRKKISFVSSADVGTANALTDTESSPVQNSRFKNRSHCSFRYVVSFLRSMQGAMSERFGFISYEFSLWCGEAHRFDQFDISMGSGVTGDAPGRLFCAANFSSYFCCCYSRTVSGRRATRRAAR